MGGPAEPIYWKGESLDVKQDDNSFTNNSSSSPDKNIKRHYRSSLVFVDLNENGTNRDHQLSSELIII